MPVLPSPQRAASGQYVSVDLGMLRVGTKLRGPLWEDRTDGDVLLLAAGTVLSDATLDLLKSRGIRNVRAHPRDVGRPTAPRGAADRSATASIAPEPERIAGNHWGISSKSFLNSVTRPGPKTYSPAQVDRYASALKESVAAMEVLYQGLAAGNLAAAPELASVARSALDQIAEDVDLFVSLGLVPTQDSYFGQHSLKTAMLAMSIGTVLGLSRQDLIELAIGCLIHDAGMLRLRVRIDELPRELSTLEFLEVTKHPGITYDLLRNLREVSAGARHVAYQMHERCNGSGYPRRRVAGQIHPLAKIAAVADVFHALISRRPWREPTLPYEAMKKIIFDTRQGLFDVEVVRGLLRVMSLFPIGSWVETSDGRVGKVIRSNGEQYTRPIVELWTPAEGQSAASIVDLAELPELRITRPLMEAPVPAPACPPAPLFQFEPEWRKRDSGQIVDHWE